MDGVPKRALARVRRPEVTGTPGDRLVDRVAAARVLAWVLLIATPLELVLVMALHGHGRPTWQGIAIAGAATATGWFLLFAHRRLPGQTVPVVIAFATLLQTLLVISASEPSGAVLFGYVWITLLAVYALPAREAMLQVALAGGGHAIALVVVGDVSTGAYIQWGLTLVTMAVAALVVAALRRRVNDLVDGLAEAGRRDPLTGLPNRRGFHEVMEAEVERAGRSGSPLALLVGDVDGLAEVNEKRGQEAGDGVLRDVADVLADSKRRIDVATRIDGEEFAIILPETDEHGAYVLADRLRRTVRDRLSRGDTPVTVSFGVATFPSQAPSVEALLHSCYQALEVAKRLGGDRTVIYNPEVSGRLIQADAERHLNGQSHLAAVLVLAETLDMRDSATARHSQTVGRYAKLIAHELGLPRDLVERVHLAGILHDVGKVGVPDAILRKAGPLDEAEWSEMRKHPELGARILDGANLDDISEWVLAHHERPDGGGYPQGLAGDEIPLPARILAVADSYEAMTTDRVYRPALPDAEARLELERGRGTQFDPKVVRAFIEALDREAAQAVAGAS